MVNKLNTIIAICLAVAAPALAFAPQGPLSSRILSTSAQPFEKTKLFMSDDGEVRSECHNTIHSLSFVFVAHSIFFL
jgi:hypothetical protein